MLIKFLGTSSGEAIPRRGCRCRQCRSKDSRDRRQRSAILINGRLLLDAGPDILEQLKPRQRENIEAVILTHGHKDHIAGLKDLLPSLGFRSKIYLSLATLKILEKILKPYQGRIEIIPFKRKIVVADWGFFFFPVPHSVRFETLGIIIEENNKRVFYLPDCSDLKKTLAYFLDLKLAILDGSMLKRDFGGHEAMEKQIDHLRRAKKRIEVYFTHNGHTKIAHQELEKHLQEIGGKNIHLAYDGLELEI